MQAKSAAQPADTSQAVQPSFAEQIIDFGRTSWRHLTQLDAGEAGLNLLVSAGILLLCLGAIWLLRRVFDHWLGRFVASCGDSVEDGQKRTPKAAGITWGLLKFAVLALALVGVAGVWGIDPLAWLSGEGGARLVRLALILVLTTALVEVAGFMIRRMVASFAQRSADSRRAAQIRTLGPLLTGLVQGVLAVVGVITFLSELGVQVAPLLASAGVLGIAVGFGAQTIVKDFLTGLFLIVEDVVSVGDNVRIGDASGTVEAMTLRTIRLRNMNGTLHIFPYSEAQVIHNRTKTFSSYIFDLQVSYSADIDHALTVMARVGEELRADPQFGPMIQKPFEVLGVDKLADSGVVLRAKVTTEPRSQWQVGREYNRRIKLAFDAEGIEIPFPTIQLIPSAKPEDLPEVEGRPTSEPRSFDVGDARPQS